MDFFKPQSEPTPFSIYVYVFAGIFGILFLSTLCKYLYQWWKKREDRRQLAQASAHALELPPSVYTIPVSHAQEQRHGPTIPQLYPPSPAYNELMPKPDFPSAPPPAYTEVIGSPINTSAPDQITPSCPPLPQ